MTRPRRYSITLAAGVLAALAFQTHARIVPRAARPQAAFPAAGEHGGVSVPRGLELAFEPNVGQAGGGVRFLARGSGLTALFTDSEAVLVLHRPAGAESSAAARAVLRMRLEGAAPAPALTGVGRLPGAVNYFRGNDPARWRTGVPRYGRIRYSSVYPGVDLEWYSAGGRLEYDFVVAPGADPSNIQIAFEGVDSLRVDGRGDLVLQTPLGEVRQQRPRVFQESSGRRREIAARYTITARGRVGFALARYDRSRALRIDPLVMVSSTFLGAGGSDRGAAVAVDASGAVYIAGSTNSVNFPVLSQFQGSFRGGDCDVFVTKLTPDGDAIEYSTYLGGAGLDAAEAIAVDSAGAVVVTGRTASADYPTRSAVQAANRGETDVFVTKLNAAGNALLFSTYLGGDNHDSPGGVALDASGAVYIAGTAQSADFPILSAYKMYLWGLQDAFVAKLKADGALLYSTFLGGSGRDSAFGVAVDSEGSVFVAGATPSENFPVQSPLQAANRGGANDAFVAKLTPDGRALAYSTYLGGTGDDVAYRIAVGADGSAFVAGSTDSSDFPLQSPFQASKAGKKDLFVAKLAASGGSLVYSTFLGGSEDDTPGAFAADGDGAVVIAGTTVSPDFPTRSPHQAVLRGTAPDAFLARLNAAGDALTYSTYLGGEGEDAGLGVALESSGTVWVAGATASPGFPVLSALYSIYRGGLSDAFVARYRFDPAPAVASVVSAASFEGGGVAPGEIVSIFGADLGPVPGLVNSGWDPATGRLPSALGGVTVTFDGQPAPLFYVSGGQINAQAPYELAGKATTVLVVRCGGRDSVPVILPVVASHPGVFTYGGRAIITDNATGALVTPASPIARGGDVVVWATGGGAVTPPAATGAPVAGLSHVANPQAWIGGTPVDVQYAGMTPGMAGLVQINLRVPADAPVGPDVPLRLAINGVEARVYTGGLWTGNLTIAIR